MGLWHCMMKLDDDVIGIHILIASLNGSGSRIRCVSLVSIIVYYNRTLVLERLQITRRPSVSFVHDEDVH
jgi:hypothetical protein